MANRKQILILGILFIMGACGSSTGSTTTADPSALSTAFPDDLAIASITASSEDASPSISAGLKALGVKAVELDSETPTEKAEDIGNLLGGDAEDLAAELADMKNDINIFATPPVADCYGPTLAYSNHPGGGSGTLPPGDLGIWTETETATGEACVAAKLNNIIGQFEAYLNAGTKTIAATLGAASLEDATDEIPAAGASIDLTETANTLLEANDIPIVMETATLEREASNTGDGFPVLVTSVEGSMDLTDGDATFTVTLEHIPEIAATELDAAISAQETVADETYCGRLTQGFSVATANPMNCGGATGATYCTLVEYCKDSATSMTYHLRSAEFCGADVDCGTVNPDDKYDAATNTDGWGSNFYYTICNVNPVTGAGSCAQAWQAGYPDGDTRVLNVEVDENGDGCGYFGFGPDVGADSGVGGIDSMICNWAGPGNSHTGLPKAQRQCFSKNDDGLFVSNSSNLAISYAPTNSCDKSAGDATFSYTGVAAGVAVNDNLIDLVDVDFTVPTLPVVP